MLKLIIIQNHTFHMIEEKVESLGLTLPGVPKPAGSYIPSLRINDLVFISGQVPFIDGNLLTGKIGSDITLEEGFERAKICALNALAVVKAEIGSLDDVKRIVKVSGYVNCVDSFVDHPKVINGASDLFGELFGELGQHTRIAIGSNSLPMNSSVELDVIFQVKQ